MQDSLSVAQPFKFPPDVLFRPQRIAEMAGATSGDALTHAGGVTRVQARFVAVHHQSKDAQGAAIERTLTYWQSHNIPYVTLRDGEALLVDGNKAEVVR